MKPKSKSSSLCVLATALLLAVTAHAADPKKTAEGSDPNGDTIEWSDGTTWTRVTITTLEVRGDNAVTARLEITNVPPGFTAGWFTNFATVAMRGEALPPKRTDTISASQLYTPGYIPPSFRDLPPLKRQYKDIYACPWQEAWSRRTFMPENSAQATMDGKPVLLQFGVVVTHLSVERGQLYCLVRHHSANKSAIEGWFSGISKVLFGREPDKE